MSEVNNKNGIIYLGRIPHGFYEEQMKIFLSQFGKILRLKLARNKRTGKSQHHAFIQFDSDEVADIVADVLNDYILMNHKLDCKRILPEKAKDGLFKGIINPEKLKLKKAQIKLEIPTESSEKRKARLLEREEIKRKLLSDMEIEYTFPGYKAKIEEKKPVKSVKPVKEKAIKKRKTT